MTGEQRDVPLITALGAKIERLEAEIERLTAERAKLITLLAEARGPQGETEERVAEWLRGRGYICALENKP